MKIIIACSMSAASLCVRIKDELEQSGHEVTVPKNIDKFASGELKPEQKQESTEQKIKHDLIRGYFNKIAESDALLVVNHDKGSQKII